MFNQDKFKFFLGLSDTSSRSFFSSNPWNAQIAQSTIIDLIFFLVCILLLSKFRNSHAFKHHILTSVYQIITCHKCPQNSSPTYTSATHTTTHDNNTLNPAKSNLNSFPTNQLCVCVLETWCLLIWLTPSQHSVRDIIFSPLP